MAKTSAKTTAKATPVAAATKAVAAKKDETKKVAAPAKKEEAKKEAATTKKTAATTKKTAATAKKAETKKTTSAKKPAAKKAAAKKPAEKIQEVFVEFQGAQYKTADIIEKIHEVYKAEGHRVGAIKSLRVYIDPTQHKAFYVINDKAEDKYIEL